MRVPEDNSLDAVREQVGRLRDRLEAFGEDGRSSFDGMDPWQQALESRLGQLRRDTRRLADDNSAVQTDVAALRKRAARLASKGFILAALAWVVIVMGAVIVFSADIRAAAIHGWAAVAEASATDGNEA